MKNSVYALFFILISVSAKAQEINSTLPCSGAEAWQYTNDDNTDWEEIILCDLSGDPETWSWY